MAWHLLHPLAHEEMVNNQYRTGLDSNELKVQVATTGSRRIEDLMQIARSLEAVEGEETGHPQARFAEEEEYKLDATPVVEQILAKLEPELRSSRNPKRHHQTPGSQRVHNAEKIETQTFRMDQSKEQKREKSRRLKGPFAFTYRSRSASREGPPQCFKCKGYGHFM